MLGAWRDGFHAVRSGTVEGSGWMKLGCRISPCFRGDGGFEEFVAFCGELGLDAVDCPTMNAEIAACCEKHGMAIGSVDGMFFGMQSDDPAERERAAVEARERVDAIAEHGGKVMFVAIGAEDPSMTRAQAFGNWKQSWPALVKHAEERGIRIAVEPWPGPPAPRYKATLGCTPEMLRAMYEAIPSPALGLCYDPSHMVRLRSDYRRLLEEFKDRIAHVHLKDTVIYDDALYEFGTLGPCIGEQPYKYGGAYWRYAIPGDGEIDWKWVLGRLDDIRYDGVLSIELEDHYYADTPELQKQGITKAAEYIRLQLAG